MLDHFTGNAPQLPAAAQEMKVGQDCIDRCDVCRRKKVERSMRKGRDELRKRETAKRTRGETVAQQREEKNGEWMVLLLRVFRARKFYLRVRVRYACFH